MKKTGRNLSRVIPAIIFLFLVTTLVTQIGGVLLTIGGLIGFFLVRRTKSAALGGAVIMYVAGLVFVPFIAKPLGREALPWKATDQSPLRPRNMGYCLLFRNYVDPELASVLKEIAGNLSNEHPGATLNYLDACFPFIDGMPLLPHLSHSDGKKIDLTFFYRNQKDGKFTGSPSPIGYWIYEGPQNGEKSPCGKSWLRWDFPWIQSVNRRKEFDLKMTRQLLQELSRHSKTKRIFIEPHLKQRMGLSSDKIRFQGCHAARHDDHIHVEIE